MDILIQFDNFCKNEGLYYTLSGGTLLGAIRHKGFIPSTIANMAKMVCEKFGDGKINVELAALKGNYVDKRPAGNFIQYDNGIYHALQECGRVYGEYLHLCKLGFCYFADGMKKTKSKSLVFMLILVLLTQNTDVYVVYILFIFMYYLEQHIKHPKIVFRIGGK